MVEAKWAMKCPGCGDDVAEGDIIGLVDGDWVCADCVEEGGGEDFPAEVDPDAG